MKLFTHLPLATALPELSSITENGKRFYTTPDGNVYPSVTTALSILSCEAIEEWKNKVGPEEAIRISEHAARRGTALHAVIESHLKNESLVFPDDPRSKVRLMFNQMKRNLSKIDNIVAQEIPLYSDKLKIAGRTDCIGEYDHVLSVIDFKSATKAKKVEWITSYFLQGTAYSLMFEERTGVKIDQIVILMTGECDFSCQVFIDSRDKYIEKLEETIAAFHAQNV